MIPIILAELRQRRWSMLWWTLGISAFLILTLAVYPSFRSQAPQLDASLQSIPKAARNLFTDTGNFLSPIGYLSSQVYYLLLPLLMSFLAISLGSSLIAREEQQRTIELLLARPVSRAALLCGKAIAGFITLITVSAAVAAVASTAVGLIGFDGVRPQNVLLATLMCALLALLCGTVAFTLTAIGRLGRGASIGVAVLVALGGYIVSSLDGMAPWLRWAAQLLPFHYYHPAEILGGHFAAGPAAGMAAAVCALMLIAWAAFRRRDIA